MSEADEFLDLAEESLNDLESVSNISDRLFWNSLYYSVFYGAKAALLSLGFEPKTHQGTDRLVGKILYKDENFIEAEDAKFFSRMKTVREEIDYNPSAKISRDKDKSKEMAQEFIRQMKVIVDKNQ